MEMDDPGSGQGRPVTTRATEGETPEQRRLARQAERIRDMERLMRGAAAFSRKSGE